MKRAAIRPPIKYHGGKYFLCPWLIECLPSHTTYIEAFGGAASVLLNKPVSPVEVYNDLEYSVYNLFLILKTEFPAFHAKLQTIPYERAVYQEHRKIYRSGEFDELSPLMQAVTTYVVRRMSRGGLCGTFSWSTRINKNNVCAEVAAYQTMLNELPKISQRLQNVEVLNRSAMNLILQRDGPDVLFYLDPPYVPKVRVFKQAYLQEMTEIDHCRLAEVLRCVKGKVLLSGYPSPLYTQMYSSWNREERIIPNHSSHERKKGLMTECLWRNF